MSDQQATVTAGTAGMIRGGAPTGHVVELSTMTDNSHWTLFDYFWSHSERLWYCDSMCLTSPLNPTAIMN